MLLMIFVNDLWSLTDIPEWLEHKGMHDDGMGLADVVFPAFLFIVGLSIPHAITYRINKGDSSLQVLWHIAERSLALLIMGVFMVNHENIDGSGLLISKHYWKILMALAFFLIWNVYRGKALSVIPAYVMKLTGVAILIFLAVIYTGRSGDGSSPWMKFHWWGILGIIGWGYLLSALVYLGLRDRPGWIALVFLLMLLMNIVEHSSLINVRFLLIVSASNYASVMSGVLVTVLLIRLKQLDKMNQLILWLSGFVAILMIFGFLTRPEWGISKMRATPSWTAICAGLSTASFILFHIISDRMKLTRWAYIISPAGTSTLTCYMIPYFVYPLYALIGFHLTGILATGMVGLIKSLVFSLLVVWITGLLGKINVKLKI